MQNMTRLQTRCSKSTGIQKPIDSNSENRTKKICIHTLACRNSARAIVKRRCTSQLQVQNAQIIDTPNPGHQLRAPELVYSRNSALRVKCTKKKKICSSKRSDNIRKNTKMSANQSKPSPNTHTKSTIFKQERQNSNKKTHCKN